MHPSKKQKIKVPSCLHILKNVRRGKAITMKYRSEDRTRL